MDYRKLSDYCSYGWADKVRKMLKESPEKCDLFWNDNYLFKKAAMQGGADVLNVLIEYYKNSELKALDSESDEYLHKLQPLIKAMQAAYDSTTRILPEVLVIFKQYMSLDEDNDSIEDLADMPDPIFEDTMRSEGSQAVEEANNGEKLLGLDGTI